MPRSVIISNPRSGPGPRGEPLATTLARVLSERGDSPREIAFEPGGRDPARWRRQLDDALAGGAERVFVLGGDGTVLAVAAALLGGDVPLGIVPLGTANLLARDLAIPLDPLRAIAALVDGEVRRIDVARVNGHPFLCASMLGIATALALARERARGGGALAVAWRVLRKALAMLRRYPYRRVRLELDGTAVTLRTRTMVITNNPVAPEPALYPRRPRLDDGTLGVYGVCEGPVWELPRLALRLVNGTWPDDPLIFHHLANRVAIHGRRRWRVTVLTDGERVRLRLPLRYEVLPAALPVLAPPPVEQTTRTAVGP